MSRRKMELDMVMVMVTDMVNTITNKALLTLRVDPSITTVNNKVRFQCLCPFQFIQHPSFCPLCLNSNTIRQRNTKLPHQARTFLQLQLLVRLTNPFLLHLHHLDPKLPTPLSVQFTLRHLHPGHNISLNHKLPTNLLHLRQLNLPTLRCHSLLTNPLPHLPHSRLTNHHLNHRLSHLTSRLLSNHLLHHPLTSHPPRLTNLLHHLPRPRGTLTDRLALHLCPKQPNKCNNTDPRQLSPFQLKQLHLNLGQLPSRTCPGSFPWMLNARKI